MVRNIALMGRAGAGKDTAAEILANRHGHVRVAFADPLRRMALAVDPIVYAEDSGYLEAEYVRLSELVDCMGWDAAKRDYPEVRRFLQRLGSEGVRDVLGSTTWIDLAHREVRRAEFAGKRVALTDVRFPNEVEYARSNGFRLVWIDRPGVNDAEHASESAVGPADADVVVSNSGTLVDLRMRLELAMRRGVQG